MPEASRRRPMSRRGIACVALLCATLALAACGGGGGGEGGDGAACTPSAGPQGLTVADVNAIIAQAANEANGRGAAATITVVDRTGNILAVARTGAGTTETITSTPRVPPGPALPPGAPPFTLENTAGVIASELTSIAKAITGAYLSSNGNAFSTRTASYIVQEHFPPLVTNQPGGPLFGVQFSQLPCGDLVRVHDPTAPDAGPHRSPLGLSADPGGLPLYKSGTLVGGIGVSADRIYGLDRDPTDFDTNADEVIALAGAAGYDAPSCITANRVSVGGLTLRYVDADASQFSRSVAATGAFALAAVAGYYDGAAIRAGTTYGTVASGIAREGSAGEAVSLPEVEAFGLYAGGVRRFAPIAGTDGASALSAAEVARFLTEGLKIAARSRAQIRRPLNSPVEVTVSVVDTNGVALGVARTPDAPIFGTDVSLQKARSAMFFSLTGARADLPAVLNTLYTDPAATFLGLAPGAFPTSARAFAVRSIGNIARPFYPDGIDGPSNEGPLSLPFQAEVINGHAIAWSPFGTGLQLDLVLTDIVNALGGGGPPANFCGTGIGLADAPDPATRTRLANGLQIFAGGVPLYRIVAGVPVLVGAIGVSGDGIDQDDMVAFLGANNGGALLGGAVGNAPPAIRADQLDPGGQGNLRYVNCPFAPFLDSDQQTPCNGL